MTPAKRKPAASAPVSGCVPPIPNGASVLGVVLVDGPLKDAVLARSRESGKAPQDVLLELATQGDRCARANHDGRIA